MPVPDYETLMLPVLRCFAEGAKSVKDCLPSLIAEFAITPDEAGELIPSGRVTLLANRAHWARTYMSKAGLLESPRRNVHEITAKARALLASNPDRIDNGVLASFEGFEDWRQTGRRNARPDPSPEPRQANRSTVVPPVLATPEERLETAHAEIDAALAAELRDLLQNVTPQRLERIIVDLLLAMGYGGGRLEQGRATPLTRDGGIDGVIDEDALGLDAVYIQAKRYAPGNTVGRPDIQRFVGSMTGEGATKGVFVTTSDFSREARDYVARVQQRIVLIDGERLARLMIAHEVGVRARQAYVIRSVDEDYFATD
jgi:restriction system protein